MYTFQDFQNDLKSGAGGAVTIAIKEHCASALYVTAVDADRYDHQKNTTIMTYARMVGEVDGRGADEYAANNRLASNFFERLNTQRNTYSLGNGVYFQEDGVKDKLGKKFDSRLRTAGYDALIHGVSFVFWNLDHIHVFPVTEFAPLFDEDTGALRAGVRFWQLDAQKPGIAVLYEEDGYTKLKGTAGFNDMRITEQKRAYRVTTSKAPADAEPEVIAEENYSTLPIVPLYGSRKKQSTLVGLKPRIDVYDLVDSGFADDLQECAEIFWIVSNAGGMDDEDLAKFRQRLRNKKIANIEDADEVSITPYSQPIPTDARTTFLQNQRNNIYEFFGGLDVHVMAAGATNDHIAAAYQPLDENADDFEFQLSEMFANLLLLVGVEEAEPLFKRNRIANQKEIVEMVNLTAEHLDDRTYLTHIPFLEPDEVEEVMKAKADEQMEAYGMKAAIDKLNEPQQEEQEEEKETPDEE